MTDTTYTMPAVLRIVLFPDGHEIRADLLQRVRSRIPELDRNRDYSLEEICGKEFWKPLPKSHKIRGGRTGAYLVQTGQLPLEFASCPHAVPKRYRLK
jgi:hypothetical protein